MCPFLLPHPRNINLREHPKRNGKYLVLNSLSFNRHREGRVWSQLRRRV